jgi:uncharacterized protein
MSHRFAEIMFTPGVKAMQERYQTRAHNERLERNAGPNTVLTQREAEFVEARDGFYLATVTETGWPYIQFRGGPRGFIRALDAHTLGYDDLRGNLQYISMGNLAANDRVALFFMDYRNRARLKLLGRARVEDVPHPAVSTPPANKRAPVERSVRIAVEAFDWNCPRHITPRYAEDELEWITAPLHARITELEAALARVSAAMPSK